jgi:hypothetical protein
VDRSEKQTGNIGLLFVQRKTPALLAPAFLTDSYDVQMHQIPSKAFLLPCLTTFASMDDAFYNAGFGLYYLRIEGLYYKRLRRANWELITQEQVKSPLWSKLTEKHHKTFVQQLKEQGLIT